MNRPPETLPRESCKNRQLYKVRARNIGPLAVYDESIKGFVGLRRKFGTLFLDIEYHYDNGPPYGTACPLEELDLSLPEEISLSRQANNALFAWLKDKA